VSRSQNMTETLAWLRANGFLRTSERALVPFVDWESVLEAAIPGEFLLYQAPLDRYCASLEVLRVYKNGGIRVRHPELTFTADSGHLSRFRMRGVVATPSLPRPPASKGVL
jgi:hypothetical protein